MKYCQKHPRTKIKTKYYYDECGELEIVEYCPKCEREEEIAYNRMIRREYNLVLIDADRFVIKGKKILYSIDGSQPKFSYFQHDGKKLNKGSYATFDIKRMCLKYSRGPTEYFVVK